MNEKLLINMYNQRIPIARIQERFGISESYVYAILNKNQVIKNKSKPETIARENSIIQDYQNGMNINDILIKYNINNAASLYSILNKRKIKKRFEEKREVNLEQILKLYNEGKSPREIGETTGRSRAFIRRLLLKNNIKLRKTRVAENKEKIIRTKKRKPRKITIKNITKEKQKINKIKDTDSYEIQKIINLYKSGKSPKLIGEKFNKTGSQVRYILQKNDIQTRRGRGLSKTKEIIRLYNQKYSTVEIGKKIECSDVTVGRILKNNNISIREYTRENNKAWKGGITPINKIIRNSPYNKDWCIQNFIQYDRKSQISNSTQKIQCHHIYGFQFILKSSIAKHMCLPDDLKNLAMINDTRFYDLDNGLVVTKQEHTNIEKNNKSGHPYWKIWKSFPEFALQRFPFTQEQYSLLNENGQLNPQNSKITQSGTTDEIKKTIRYEHYLGTIPPHKLILTSHINGIIAGIAAFGQGANKNMPKNTWELTRLCVPYYIIRPFTIQFLSICVNYIKNNFPEIQQLISYADPNVGHDGAVYRMSGWTKEAKTKPSYAYFDTNTNQLRHKSFCRRIKNVNKTEKELAQERSLIKIPLLPKRKYSLSI